MKNSNVSPETLKLLEENTGSMLFDISSAILFLYLSPQAREIKAKINKWDYIKLKIFWRAKETTDKTKRPSTEWGKIYVNDLSDKGLISSYTKNVYNSMSNKQPD